MTDPDMRTEIVPQTWMVAYRTFDMSGGVFTYGIAEIHDYYPSFEKADAAAYELSKRHSGEPDLHVWVLRCEKTYCNAGVAISKY